MFVGGAVSVQDQLRNLQGDIQRQLSHNSDLLQQLRKFREQKQSGENITCKCTSTRMHVLGNKIINECALLVSGSREHTLQDVVVLN